MAVYKTFNIDFTDWYDRDTRFYEVARDTKEALAKFYDEISRDGSGLTRITNICESNASNYYVLKVDDDIFEYRFDDADKMFYDVSKVYAFDDCCPEMEVLTIVSGGMTVRYRGWQPGMKFEYVYCDGTTAWTSWHSEWDH